ncbi:hypothetical protein MYAM1_003025 [Malassezia yamatoensis]|uniref:COP9 signalosome complex subunit 7 n=1 Tax=Malassezia yamatoensis TaxID=253288 RepID=A0AAJ5YV21_9BASI|nr:hypothetical protein MYAM1_003025 [Malassezia yamatoensis]
MDDAGSQLTETLRRLEHCDSCEQAANLLSEAFDTNYQGGKWSDYEADKSLYITLSGSQTTKLRQLTLLSLMQSSRVLSYAAMISALDLERKNAEADGISTVRLLEDLIIDGISHQLFDGRLDGETENFYADRVSARDVPRPLGYFNGEDSLVSLSDALSRWSERAQEVAQMLDQHIHLLREEDTARQQDQTANHDAMVRALTQARNSPDARLSSHLQDVSEKPLPSAKYVL